MNNLRLFLLFTFTTHFLPTFHLISLFYRNPPTSFSNMEYRQLSLNYQFLVCSKIIGLN